jgi:hypothetical protein
VLFFVLFLCLLVLVFAVGTYASMKFCDLGFRWAQGLEFKVWDGCQVRCKDCLALTRTWRFSHMANLTPCFSTLRYIVPVASSGPTLSQYVPSLATMQMPCPHLLRVTHECIVYSLHSSFLNNTQSLRHGMQLICLKDLDSEAPGLKSEFCIRGLEGRFAFCFWHLLAEIFGAISLCSF